MKVVSFFVATIILLSGCTDIDKSQKIEGIWIPEKVNWHDGSFHTFYFYNDTSFVLLASTQKMINDSIYFQAEPGFRVNEGRIIVRKDNEVTIAYKVLYAFIRMIGEKYPGDEVRDTIRLSDVNNDIIGFEYKGTSFVKTDRYTQRSVQIIKSFPVEMIPELKKGFENNTR